MHRLRDTNSELPSGAAQSSPQLSEQERNCAWSRVIQQLRHRLHAYLSHLPCSRSERREIFWDVWAAAFESESNILSARDPWLALAPVLRAVCAERVGAWRTEAKFASEARAMVIEPGSNAMATNAEAGIADSSLCTIARLEWADVALRQLPPNERLAVDYRHRWGWPYPLVGAALSISESSARVYVARGLARIPALYAEIHDESSDQATD